MKKLIRLCVLLALSASVVAAEDHPKTYAAVAPVATTHADGLQRIELPLSVLQASRSEGWTDVRLFDASSTALPQAWAGAQAAAPEVQRTVALPRFAWPVDPMQRQSDGGSSIQIDAAGAVVRIQGPRVVTAPKSLSPTRWLLDSSSAKTQADERWHRLVLDWDKRPGGVSTHVRVEASDDARSWRAVTQTALLELDGDASAPVQKHIDWPAGVAVPKYLRLSFDTELALTRTDLVLASAAVPAALPSQRLAFAFDDAQRAWTLDLLGRVPVARLRVHVGTVNSIAALRLEQRHDEKTAWQPVTSFVAWRLVRDGVESESPAVDVRAVPARHWRLVADPRTPLPSTPIDATIEWRAPMLVFAARQAQGLQLAVGKDKAVAANLPLSSVMPGYQPADELKLPLASVGPLAAQVVATPGLPERLRDASAEDRKRWLLWGVLGLAVAGLAVLAMRLARDVKKNALDQEA